MKPMQVLESSRGDLEQWHLVLKLMFNQNAASSCPLSQNGDAIKVVIMLP